MLMKTYLNDQLGNNRIIYFYHFSVEDLYLNLKKVSWPKQSLIFSIKPSHWI